MNHSGGAMVRETHRQSDEPIGVALARVTLPLPLHFPPFDDKRHAIFPLLIVCPQEPEPKPETDTSTSRKGYRFCDVFTSKTDGARFAYL